MDHESSMLQAMNRLAKWRSIFAGWQLGTRAKDDPECEAVRDHREATIIMRAEVNALTRLLIEKNVCTLDEVQEAFKEEADALSKSYEETFPGMKATDTGISIDPAVARETMRNWRP